MRNQLDYAKLVKFCEHMIFTVYGRVIIQVFVAKFIVMRSKVYSE